MALPKNKNEKMKLADFHSKEIGAAAEALVEDRMRNGRQEEQQK